MSTKHLSVCCGEYVIVFLRIIFTFLVPYKGTLKHNFILTNKTDKYLDQVILNLEINCMCNF